MQFSICRPTLSLMVGMIPVLFGMLTILELPFVREEKAHFPGIAIRTEARGLDASKVESEITRPIERVISQVGGVRKMTSVSEDGISQIQLQLDSNQNLKTKSLEFREKIDTILTLFPKNIHRPQVYRYDPSHSPLMVLSFSKKYMNPNELRDLVEKSFKSEFESIEGVSQVLIAGGKIREIQISCDAKQLEAYSLSLRNIVDRISETNQNDSLGKIRQTKLDYLVQTRARWKQMHFIRDLPIRLDSAGGIVYLKDIAEVNFLPRDEEIGARINAQEKVSLFLYKNDASDPIVITDKIYKILHKKNISQIQIEFSQDESLLIRDTTFGILKLVAIFLTVLCFYHTFFYKASFPFFLFLLSLFFSFFSLCFMHSMVSKSLSLSGMYGFVLGACLWYLLRNKEISISQTNILYREKTKSLHWLIAVFISLLISNFLSSVVFRFYFMLCVQMILTFYFMDYYFPILSAHSCFKFQGLKNYSDAFYFTLRRLLSYFSRKQISILKKWEDSLLSDRKILPITSISILLFSFYSLARVDFYDNIQSDAKQTFAILEFPSGTSFAHTSEITLQVEKKLNEMEEVKQVISKIDPSHSLLLLTLEDGILPYQEFLLRMKAEIGNTSDGFLYFPSEPNSNYFQEILFEVIGPEQEVLEEITKELTEKIKDYDGVSEAVLRYKQAREELQLIPKSESMKTSDLTVPMFGDELHLALQGGIASKFLSDEKEIDIRVRYSEKYRNSKQNFHNIRIKNTKGQMVPISELVELKEGKIPLKYYHKNRSRMLGFSVKLDGNSSRLRSEVEEYIKSYALPEGYRIESEKEAESFNSSKSNLVFLCYPLLYSILFFQFIKNKIPWRRLYLQELLPYYFSYFLLQRLFPGPMYLPFQIGMLLSLPFSFFAGKFRLIILQNRIHFFCGVTFIFVLFFPETVLSFFQIWICLTISTVCHFLILHFYKIQKKKFR
nr:efflux RND transporter permease subunit [Leptospira ognonensis]